MRQLHLKQALACLGFLLGLMLTLVSAAELPEAVQTLRERCMKIIGDAARHDDSFIRSGAIRAAGESEDPELLALLEKGARDFFPTTRQFALQGLPNVSRKLAIKAALGALKDSNVWVASTALETLAEHGGTEVLVEIEPLLKSPDPMVRLAAEYASYRLGQTGRFETLVAALEGGDTIRRYQAITYMGRIGNERALSQLGRILENSGEEEILFYALKAIEGKAPIELLHPLEKLTEHKNPRVRRQAVLVLGQLPSSAGQERVVGMCVDADPLVQVAAAVAAARLKSRQCDEVFTIALQHPDYGVRSVAARVLGKLEVPHRRERLIQALNDGNSRVRTAAVRATGMMGGTEAFPLLLQMLEDSTEVIRAYAAGYILKILKQT